MQRRQICLLQSNTRRSLDRMTLFFRYLVLPIYWAILTYMLLKPGEENKEYLFMFSGADKMLHLSIFAFLGLCTKAAYPRLSFTYYIISLFAYALLTEILQEAMHLGRSMEALDLLADTVGLLLGQRLFPLFQRLLMRFF